MFFLSSIFVFAYIEQNLSCYLRIVHFIPIGSNFSIKILLTCVIWDFKIENFKILSRNKAITTFNTTCSPLFFKYFFFVCSKWREKAKIFKLKKKNPFVAVDQLKWISLLQVHLMSKKQKDVTCSQILNILVAILKNCFTAWEIVITKTKSMQFGGVFFQNKSIQKLKTRKADYSQ